jgi:hypothetical protein
MDDFMVEDPEKWTEEDLGRFLLKFIAETDQVEFFLNRRLVRHLRITIP